MANEGINKRGFFRLEYPPSDRPTLTIDKQVYPIVDLSEQGVRFACGKKDNFNVGDQLKGTIAFHNKQTVQVEGQVLRLIPDPKAVVVKLTKGIPLQKMMEEQRYIIAKYKQP